MRCNKQSYSKPCHTPFFNYFVLNRTVIARSKKKAVYGTGDRKYIQRADMTRYNPNNNAITNIKLSKKKKILLIKLKAKKKQNRVFADIFSSI